MTPLQFKRSYIAQQTGMNNDFANDATAGAGVQLRLALPRTVLTLTLALAI